MHMPVMGDSEVPGHSPGLVHQVAPGAEVGGIPLVSGASHSVVMSRPSCWFSKAEQGEKCAHGNSRDEGVMAAGRGHQFDQGHSLLIPIPIAGQAQTPGLLPVQVGTKV